MNKPFLSQLTVSFFKEGVSMFFIGNAFSQEMIHNHQDTVSDSHCCPFFSPPSSNATKLGSEIPLFLAGDDMSSLEQETTHPRVPFACFATQAFARTLI